ncbi:glycosyltransferase, group 2 family protein [Sphingobacterium spiritivorum ATCC 33300]|uniref:Glycosyltransferase, group 2 family protein n=1 Tax=Sphingobacterium spiritivorum ATCC 33300 TaxID=525372 RepID=C2FUJ2_SPHSI|nr:glycosyltransferase [Sphingobacterium spiritivorum]EEI93422.1 glycosyltransferase, group 2 family protein [Sphingobacterium spiritivorum ATCC 33300]QQS95907.1 glycosyltransferase family 2 protein [Sphingobacterium spiritivorum]
MKIAVLITVFNRVEKTLLCMKSLFEAERTGMAIDFKVFMTDDGSTDGTTKIIKEAFPMQNIEILEGNGQLFWNGGMINSWTAAIREGVFDGYLWLNNDSIILPNIWTELVAADKYAKTKFGKGGIYVGSTYNKEKNGLSYGGFDFINKWTLRDKFLIPDGSFQHCEAAHGNITYVSKDVVKEKGIFCDKYIHSGGDHDYSYLAHKDGFPVFILREYVGICENDHIEKDGSDFKKLSLKERFNYLKSPLGFNLHNTLLFNRRCFPYRYPFVWLAGYGKALFPKIFFYAYQRNRR